MTRAAVTSNRRTKSDKSFSLTYEEQAKVLDECSTDLFRGQLLLNGRLQGRQEMYTDLSSTKRYNDRPQNVLII